MSFEGLRNASPDEVEELVALTAVCEGAAPWSRAVWAETLRSAQETEATRAVRVIGDQQGLLAFGVLQAVGNEGEIENLGVHPNARRQGFGRQVCADLLRWAAGRGAEVVRLEVRAANVSARALYAGVGFVEEGRRTGYYHDPVDDALLLSVDLVSRIEPNEDTRGTPLYNQ